jgi:hypothetical protein
VLRVEVYDHLDKSSRFDKIDSPHKHFGVTIAHPGKGPFGNREIEEVNA